MISALPNTSKVDVQIFSRIFESTKTSYKFAFLQALLTICRDRGFTQFDGKISFKELAVEMAVFAWYPHTFHKLSFGRLDELGQILDELNFSADGISLTNIETNKRLRTALLQDYKKINLESILRYVPFRVLTPFFEESLIGIKDHKKNSTIRDMADELFFSKNPPLYRFIDHDLKVEIHPDWLAYLQESFGVVRGWLQNNWISFLQNRNPNTPAISLKIAPPLSRSSIDSQSKLWRRIIESSDLRCIYSGLVLSPTNFEVDHFLPWSFVCHDQPWNLMPVLPEANASKNNRLPNPKYVDNFIETQFLGLNKASELLNPRQWNSHIEPYLVDLRLTEEGLLSQIQLANALKATLLPMLALANQTGFSPNWEFRRS